MERCEYKYKGIPEMKSASELAVVLAKKTRFSKYILEGAFEREEKGEDLPLITGFYNVFQETLIGSLTKERFVDLYAQTITYGLFAAKMMAKEAFIKVTNNESDALPPPFFASIS